MSEPSLSLEQRGFEYGVKHLLSPQSGELLIILAKSLSMTRDEVAFLLHMGAIYVNGTRALDDLIVSEKTYVRVHTKPRRFLPYDHLWSTRVLFSNENFIVVHKPAGLPCHPSVDNIRENVLSYLRTEFEQELQHDFFMTHRLDVPTSGILIVAKTKLFQSAFNLLLKERGLSKIYRAVCTKSAPALGRHRHYMQPSPRAPKVVQITEHSDFAVCDLEVLSCEERPPSAKDSEPSFNVTIQLLTGRTHQIRAQMAALGAPLLGDTLYGAEKFFAGDEIALTACALEFTNPITQEKHFFELGTVPKGPL